MVLCKRKRENVKPKIIHYVSPAIIKLNHHASHTQYIKQITKSAKNITIKIYRNNNDVDDEIVREREW